MRYSTAEVLCQAHEWLVDFHTIHSMHLMSVIVCMASLLQLCGMDIIAIQFILHWIAMIISH